VENMKWTHLRTPRTELNLHFTLPTGQSFRWKRTSVDEYTGVIGHRVVRCLLRREKEQSWMAWPTTTHKYCLFMQVQLRHVEDDVEWRVVARANKSPPGVCICVLGIAIATLRCKESPTHTCCTGSILL
jgi:hypothetical protein